MRDNPSHSTFKPNSSNTTLLQCLHHSVHHLPDSTVFVDHQNSISYGVFLQKAYQIAAALLDKGIGTGDRVAIILPRQLEAPIAIYGIWLSGAAYVPVDPSATDKEQISLLKHCEVCAIVTHPHLERKLSKVISSLGENLKLIIGTKGTTHNSSVSWHEVFEYSIDRDWPPVDPNNLAYILHTSGTTGKPKGIMHSHASALAYAQMAVESCAINATDVIACHSAIHTDMSTLGLFAAPLAGASALIIPDAHIRMPASLSALLQEKSVSVWYSVPQALLQLLQHGVLKQRDLSTLRLAIYAGEAIAPTYLKQLALHWPTTHFSNHYGPAETNVCTSFELPLHTKDHALLDTGLPIPIGKPWGENSILLVDSNLNLITDNSSGEILISSETTMMGYWNEPELTANSLVTIQSTDGAKLYYKSGDIAEYDSAGNLQLLGRKDRQVKVRGYRVELDAIEHQLSECEGVKQCAAFATRYDNSLQVNVVIIPSSAAVRQESISQYCQTNIYQGKLPLKFSFMEAFPTTTSGKIDRRKLAEQFTEHQTL